MPNIAVNLKHIHPLEFDNESTKLHFFKTAINSTKYDFLGNSLWNSTDIKNFLNQSLNHFYDVKFAIRCSKFANKSKLSNEEDFIQNAEKYSYEFSKSSTLKYIQNNKITYVRTYSSDPAAYIAGLGIAEGRDLVDKSFRLA